VSRRARPVSSMFGNKTKAKDTALGNFFVQHKRAHGNQ
jgi:hypothetical protein